MRQVSLDQVMQEVAGVQSLFLPGVAGQPNAFLNQASSLASPLDIGELIVGFVSGINEFERLLPFACPVRGCFPPPADIGLDMRIAPITYFEVDAFFRDVSPHAALVEVTEPDADGQCALGLAADYSQTVLESARLKIAIINPHLPKLPFAPTVQLDGFDLGCNKAAPPLTTIPARTDDLTQSIARQVASLIPDGAVIQLGIGKLPGQICRALCRHRAIRLHSGIVTEGVRLLAEAGALADECPVTAASYLGSPDFYHWLERQDSFQLEPVAYTHLPETLGTLDRFISINTAIEVDLSGAANAEWVGKKRVSAPGGLPDFARAASADPNGLSIIALPSTASKGTRSRIVQRLSGEPTVAGELVDAVVTEYGTADLRGLSIDGRLAALTAIAAPEHRGALAA